MSQATPAASEPTIQNHLIASHEIADVLEKKISEMRIRIGMGSPPNPSGDEVHPTGHIHSANSLRLRLDRLVTHLVEITEHV